MFTSDQNELEALRARCRFLEQALVSRSGASDSQATANASPGSDRNLLFSAVQAIRMPMIITNPHQPDNPIIFADQAFIELSGYSADELVGRNCRFLQGDDDTSPKTVARIREAVAARTRIAIDVINYRRDGTRFVNELYISPCPIRTADCSTSLVVRWM